MDNHVAPERRCSIESMSPRQPVVLVEDQWSIVDGTRAALSRGLGLEVAIASNYGEMVEVANTFAEDGATAEPVVVLDAGIPGVCRLESVRRTVMDLPRCRVIFWSAVEHPAAYCGALIDGAYAAVPKRRPLPTLLRVIERASTGRRWCEPAQAQWFLDFFILLGLHQAGKERGIWESTEVKGLPNLVRFQDGFEELAAGEPMPENDLWFKEALDLVRPRWLPPRLRRAQMALAIHDKRSTAADAIGIEKRSIDGYASDLSGRLMPSRFTTTVDTSDRRDHALVRALRDIHFMCELPLVEHDLRPEAF